MTNLYKIKDWMSTFENHDTKKLKNINWVSMPCNMQSAGMLEILSFDNGVEVLGVWLLLVEYASSCNERGVFKKASGGAMSEKFIANAIRVPDDVFCKSLKTLTSSQVAWIEVVTEPAGDQRETNGGLPGDCREIATSTDRQTDKTDRQESVRENNTHQNNSSVVYFPKEILEVQEAANRIGYCMTDEEAENFIAHYGANGWLNQFGRPISDWTKLLMKWKNNSRNTRQNKGGQVSKRIPTADKFKEMETEI